MTDKIVVLSTCANEEEAGKLARTLVEERLAACVSVIPGVAFLGSSDGHIRAYETGKGAVIWDFDTLRDFQTVNGVKARGGSIISTGPVIAGGMLYITSGYSGNGMPGNVLLVFSLPR